MPPDGTTCDPVTGRVPRAISQGKLEAGHPSYQHLEPAKTDSTSAPSNDGNADVNDLLVEFPLGSTEIKGGPHPRGVHQGFWAFLNGNGLSATYGDIFLHVLEDDLSFPPTHISSWRLANLLLHLPQNSVCDALLESFLVRVDPVYPLIDPSTFIPQYRLIWQILANYSSPLPSTLVKDRTYFCLVWAVLYAGASALSFSDWESTPALKGLDQLATTEQLKTGCSKALTACKHTDHPTIFSLTASIIAYHFDPDKLKGLGKTLFTATILRLAQSVGLHLPTESRQLDESTEHRRRIWWHIVWMDLQASIETGLPVCLNAEGIHIYPMISELRHKTSTRVAIQTSASASSGNAAPEPSIVILHAIGSSQTVKLQYRMISLFQHAPKIRLKDIRRLIMCTKDYVNVINEIIAKIPMRDIPEKGMISATLAAASPHVSPDLYEDLANEPTVFGTFARVDLSLWKLETVILLQHLLLPDLMSTSLPSVPWDRVVRLCLKYLQCYLQLFQGPAFAPYSYSWLYYHGPRRCTFLILHYLEVIHTEKKAQEEMLLWIDEFIDSWCRVSRAVHAPVQSEAALPPMKVIIKMRERLESEADSESEVDGESEAALPPMKVIIKMRERLELEADRESESNVHSNNSTNLPASEISNTLKDIDHLEDLFNNEFWASLE